MRTTTAYFAGVGTVVMALAAGLGGGLLFSSIVSPHAPNSATESKYAAETSRLQRPAPPATIPVTTAPSEPVPYVAATATTTPPAAAAANQTEPPVQVSAAPSVAPPGEPKTATNADAAQPRAQTTSPSSAPVEPVAARDQNAKPQDALARARDADVKRAAPESRRAERRQRWADKRRYRQPREQELDAVERAVRDDTEPRQAFMAERVKIETPRIKLFDQE